MPSTDRNYNGKDADMLIASGTIIEAAITHKVFLQSKRSTWADPFFDNLKTQIDTAIQTHLGVDSAKDLRLSTQAINGIQKIAIRDLAEFKVQVIEDFKSDKPRLAEILNQLGFTTFHKQAQTGDQEALINLLYRFKTNMTVALQTEITTKGTDATLITNTISYADTLKNADITQETFKGARKGITSAAIQDFNKIYDQIVSICKISAKFFKDSPEIKGKFSYAKTVKALNRPHSAADDAAGLPTS
jgi:hypothetical protein